MTLAYDSHNDAPWRDWRAVRDYVNHAWDPENRPHHVICGLTGSGKTYLGIEGILKPMCANDRVLIIDTKQDDPMLTSIGRPVDKLPRNPWYMSYNQQHKPYRWWYRLVVSDDPTTGKYQLTSTLNRVYDEGDWVVYFDEYFDVTGRESPYHHRQLAEVMEKIDRKGRSRRVSRIGATQEPVGVKRILFSGSSFAWLGRIPDEDRQKRLLQVGGLSKKFLPQIATLRPREWMLAADSGLYIARTSVA